MDGRMGGWRDGWTDGEIDETSTYSIPFDAIPQEVATYTPFLTVHDRSLLCFARGVQSSRMRLLLRLFPGRKQATYAAAYKPMAAK